MSELLRDLRFGFRLLAKSPVFAATAVILVAVGISSNTLIFSMVNALLLRPLPVSHPENLVRLVAVYPTGFVNEYHPYDLCSALAPREADLSEMICQGEADVALSDGKSTERVRVHMVSPNFFTSLGVSAHLGRVLTDDDERAMAANAVLSYNFWRRQFAGDPSVLGRGITLGGNPFTIVGVSPEGFNGLAADTSPDIRIAAAWVHSRVPLDDNQRAQIFGRLRALLFNERTQASMDSRARPTRNNLTELVHHQWLRTRFTGLMPDLSRLPTENPPCARNSPAGWSF